MSDRIILPLFFFCLFTCAGMVLIGIWAGKGLPPQYFQTIASFFVIGLACFLTWLVKTLRSIASHLQSNES